MSEANLSEENQSQQEPLTKTEAMRRALEEHAPKAPLKLLKAISRGETEAEFRHKERIRAVELHKRIRKPEHLEGRQGMFKASKKEYGSNKPEDMSRFLNGSYSICSTKEGCFIPVQFPDPEDREKQVVGISPAKDWIIIWGPKHEERVEREVRRVIIAQEPDPFTLGSYEMQGGLYAFYLGEREKEIIEDSDKTQGETESDTNAHAI